MCVDGEPENNRKNLQKQPADPKNDFKKEELCSRRQPSCNHNVSVVHFATGRGKTGASFPPRQTKFLALAAPQASEQAGGPGQPATRRRPVLTILMPLICPLRKGSVLGGARRPGSGSATAAPAAGWRRVGLAGAPCWHGSAGSPS